MRRKHHAFTLIELITVLALAGMGLAMLGGLYTKLHLHASHQVNTKLICNTLSSAYQQYKATYGYYPQGLTAADGSCFYFDTAAKVQALQSVLQGQASEANPCAIAFAHLPISIQKRDGTGALIALQDPNNSGCFGCYIDVDGDGWARVSNIELQPARVIFVYKAPYNG